MQQAAVVRIALVADVDVRAGKSTPGLRCRNAASELGSAEDGEKEADGAQGLELGHDYILKGLGGETGAVGGRRRE